LTHEEAESIVSLWQARPENGLARCAIMNLPNALTLLRFFILPVLIVFLSTKTLNVELWGVPVNFEVWGVLSLL